MSPLGNLLRVSTALVGLLLVTSACGSAQDSNGATITSSPPTSAGEAPTTVTTGPDATTTQGSDTETTTTSEPEPSTTQPPTTLLGVTDPTVIAPGQVPSAAPEITFIWDGLGGVFGPTGYEDWSTSAESSDGYLGPWLHVAPGPDGSLWRSRIVSQTQDCAQLKLDISRLTSPNALDFAVSLPYPAQPNCAQDVLWPAGYDETFLVTKGGLVLLHMDQDPREGCLAPDCVPDVVASIEFRPFDALASEGFRFEAVRTPMDDSDRDPELTRKILHGFARLGAASTDQGAFGLDFASLIVALDSAEPVAVPAGAIPAYDGEGHFYSVAKDDALRSGSIVSFQSAVGREPVDLFSTEDLFVSLLADSPDWLIVNLISFENADLAYYEKSTGVLYLTDLGGLPGVSASYIRAES